MIIPNPNIPTSLDRYAYALNNPLKYIDPTGLKEAGPCPSGDICDYDDGDVVVTPKKPSKGLTQWGNNMWGMYLAWRGNRNVTLIDYLKLMLSFEYAPLKSYVKRNPDDKQKLIGLLGHTATHWIYWYCGYEAGCVSDTGLSDAAILNFIGISGSMRMRFDQFNTTKVVNFDQESAPDIAEAVVNLMLNPDFEWKTGGYDSNGHPSTWGNALYPWWPDPDKVELFSNAPNGFDVNAKGHSITFKYNNFAVLTSDEVDYWKSGP